jgi:hypothetical protein
MRFMRLMAHAADFELCLNRRRHPHPGCFLELRILKDFKSLFPELRILKGFKSLFSELRILIGLKVLVSSKMQKCREVLELRILRELTGFELSCVLIPGGLWARTRNDRRLAAEDMCSQFTQNRSTDYTIQAI